VSAPRNTKVVPNIFQTGAAIYTAVVVAGSTGPQQAQTVNSKFYCHVLRRLRESVRRRRPKTMATTDLAYSPWQRPVLHFRPHPAVSGETQNGCHPPPTALPTFDTLWLLSYFHQLNWSWGDPAWMAESAGQSDRRGLTGSVPDMEETVGPVSTCGRELLWGWWRPIGLVVSFMIFTASVRNILGSPSYIVCPVGLCHRVATRVTGGGDGLWMWWGEGRSCEYAGADKHYYQCSYFW
jgi:hypothetical protein